MIKSVNQIRLELSAIQEAHLQLNSFFWGDFLRAYKENRLNYPLMGCFYPTSSILRNQTQLSLRIYVADKLFKDWSNLNDVESDTLQTCRDIFNIMNNSMRWQSIGRVQSCTVTKFINRGGDEVAGHEMTINFLIRDRDGICGLPLVDYDFDQIDGDLCFPASYTITDSESTILYSGSIVSGGTLNQPIQDSTVEITSDNGTLLHTVSVLAEGSVIQIVGDSTVNITDDSGNPLYSLSVNAEGSATQVIQDSEAVLKDTAGATISTTYINAEGSANITAPDTALEVNGTPEGSVVAGATVDVITNIVPASSSLVSNNLTLTFTKELFWELNFNGTDDVIYIPATVNNVGTLSSGSGSNVGTITVSTDGVTYGALSFPFTPVAATTYYFKRSTATVSGVYTMTGTYA